MGDSRSTNMVLETQAASQPRWTLVSQGKVNMVINEHWTLTWWNSTLPVNTDGEGEQCQSMLIQIPRFQKLGLSIIATYAPSSRATADELQECVDDLEHLIGQLQPRHIPMLIQFCTNQGLVVANTWTPQPKKTTWLHPR